MWSLLHPSVGIGRHMHQVFRTAEGSLKLGTRRRRATLQPRRAPPDNICGQTGEKHLELNSNQRPTHQMLDKERAFHFFVAGLNGLAFIVVTEPDR